ncbi:MAG TPA: hypothetical protein VGK25_07910 [Ignavibacteria bacterium]|jgi:hypothetical protein
MNIKKTKILFFLFAAFLIYSCSERDPIKPAEDTLLFEMPGLVDSAVVYGCYSQTIRYFVPDTLMLNNYSKVKIDFDGYANSDGTITFVYLKTESSQNIEVYRVENISGINRLHSFEANKPDNTTTVEVRLYINPPICGQNEFKYNRVRDLRIYGVK